MKTSFHIKETLEYILYAEMEGIVDETDPYYSAYVSLEDLLEKVLDDEDDDGDVSYINIDINAL